MDEKKYYVYMHVNIVTLKVYIGITSQRPTSRWCRGKGYKNNKIFWPDIQKYDWDNDFLHIIVFRDLSKEEATYQEKAFIEAYDSMNPKFGYNQTLGGEGSFGWHMTDAQKQQLKERLAKQFDTPEKRKAWGEKHKNHYVSQAYREKMSQMRQGDKNPTARAVICENTGQIFSTIKEAAIWAGLKSYSKVGDVCRGKSATAGKHPDTGERLKWRYYDK